MGFLPSTVCSFQGGSSGFCGLNHPKKVFQNPASIAGSSSGAKPCGKRPSSEGAMVGWELEDGLLPGINGVIAPVTGLIING